MQLTLVKNVAFSFYADDTVIFEILYDSKPSNFWCLLNEGKSNVVMFSNSKELTNLPKIKTTQGGKIETVTI